LIVLDISSGSDVGSNTDNVFPSGEDNTWCPETGIGQRNPNQHIWRLTIKEPGGARKV
jgi:hypothetical protein